MSDIYTDSMSRTSKESQRLDEQFGLLTQNLGYLLHPSVSERLPDSPVIADIGTGTGLFLVQLAKLYPTATLRGFDISPELFPAPGDLPSNVELGTMDVKKVPPPEDRNRYDVVHVRLLTAAMDPMDWDPAVRNLTLLLKPGGAIQWEECDFANTRYYRGRTNSTSSAARFMAAQFQNALKEKFSAGWNTLPQTMRRIGLTQVDEDVVSSDRIVETRGPLTANGMVAIFTWAKLMSERGVSGCLQMDELKRLEIQADTDIRSGIYVRYDIHVALGFKL